MQIEPVLLGFTNEIQDQGLKPVCRCGNALSYQDKWHKVNDSISIRRLLRTSYVITNMNIQDVEICTTNAHQHSGLGALFVDVRASHDVATLAFNVPEVINLPFDQLELRWHELQSRRELVMVCQNGSQSAEASQFLRDQGVKNVSYMRGGILLWMQKGYPVLGKRFTTLEK